MNKPALLLSIATLTLGVLCALLYRELRDERAELRELRSRLQRPAEATGAATPTAAIAETRPGPGAATEPPAVATTPVTLTTVPPDQRRESLERYRQMMNDPEFRAAMIAQNRQMVERRHPDLVRELRLTPEQAEKLYELLTTQVIAEQEFQLELNLQYPDNESNPDPAVAARRKAMYDAQMERFQNERLSLLGEDQYRQWKDYQNSTAARAQLRQLRGQLADGTAPLQDGQYQQLVPLLSSEQERHREDLRQLEESRGDLSALSSDEQFAYRKSRLELVEQSQARASEAANAYLNSEQLTQFRKLQQAELDRERTRLRLWRARQNYKASQGG